MSSAQNDAEFNAITSDVLTSSKSNTTNLYNKFVAKRCHFPYVSHTHFQIPSYWIMKLER